MEIGKKQRTGEQRPDVVVVPPIRQPEPERAPAREPVAVPDREKVPA